MPAWGMHLSQNIASFDRDETRTRNLLIRSQTPYPLGHAAGGKRTLSAELRKVISTPFLAVISPILLVCIIF